MHLDFGQDKQRLQSMLKPSGNMCKSIDKSHSGTKSSRQNNDVLDLGRRPRCVVVAFYWERKKTCTAAAMMEKRMK
jgi:hypothetical protein